MVKSSTRMPPKRASRKQHLPEHRLRGDGLENGQRLTSYSRRLWPAVSFAAMVGVVVVSYFLIRNFNFDGAQLMQRPAFWMDSGYTFVYRGHKIFFQDIHSLEPVRTSPVLLILHGFPTSSYDWRKLIKPLQQFYGRIVLPDMIGFGFSDKPVSHQYSIMEQAAIHESLLASLNISSVHILAHNYGDTVAQELLHRFNADGGSYIFKIESLCLTNGGIIPSTHQPRLIQKALMLPWIGNALSALTFKVVFDKSFSEVFGRNTQPSAEDLADFWSIIMYNNGLRAAPGILHYIRERKEHEKRWVGALQTTRVPLHLVYGPEDPINPPESFLVAYREMVPRSTVTVLENIGHYPQLEDPDGFMKSYLQFLKSV